ncbi:replication protein, partial [Vibrio parahaemolyticus]|nr:replication protein [Vibrio parahaemolyticus]MDF5285984.1 replication protein [Vibrio parahaemolyticus]
PSVVPVAIPTVKVQFQTTLENAIKHAKTQYGKLINLMSQLYADEKNSHEKIIKRLTDGLDITDIPDRINFPVGRALNAINLE